MIIRDVMKPVLEFGLITDSVRHVAERMKRLEVGEMAILDGNDVVGMITEHDITTRVIAEGRDPSTTRIGEVLAVEMFTCWEDHEVEDTLRMMENMKVRRLLVRDYEGNVSGIVSLEDLVVSIGREQVNEVIRMVSELAQPVR